MTITGLQREKKEAMETPVISGVERSMTPSGSLRTSRAEEFEEDKSTWRIDDSSKVGGGIHAQPYRSSGEEAFRELSLARLEWRAGHKALIRRRSALQEPEIIAKSKKSLKRII